MRPPTVEVMTTTRVVGNAMNEIQHEWITSINNIYLRVKIQCIVGMYSDYYRSK